MSASRELTKTCFKEVNIFLINSKSRSMNTLTFFFQNYIILLNDIIINMTLVVMLHILFVNIKYKLKTLYMILSTEICNFMMWL